MKLMKAINKLQAALTELRREIQREYAETVEESFEDQIRRCDETFIAGYRKKLDQEIMDKLKAAGEMKRCEECGRTSNIVNLDQACPFCDPDLPLHAKVAKALGWTDPKSRICPVNIERWFGTSLDGNPNVGIPRYDLDLVAAMGALEEYCENHKINYKIVSFWQTSGGFSYDIVMQDKSHGEDLMYKQLTQFPKSPHVLPQAICEAIVAHSEGK